jgi:glycosyltransferase involved in cell wall biosynthesis
VCGYRVGGLAEVVTEGVGRLVEPYDVEALARAVLEIVSDPEGRAVLGRAAREHAVARFEREPALERYEGYFRAVLDGAPGAASS